MQNNTDFQTLSYRYIFKLRSWEDAELHLFLQSLHWCFTDGC